MIRSGCNCPKPCGLRAKALAQKSPSACRLRSCSSLGGRYGDARTWVFCFCISAVGRTEISVCIPHWAISGRRCGQEIRLRRFSAIFCPMRLHRHECAYVGAFVWRCAVGAYVKLGGVKWASNAPPWLSFWAAVSSGRPFCLNMCLRGLCRSSWWKKHRQRRRSVKRCWLRRRSGTAIATSTRSARRSGGLA